MVDFPAVGADFNEVEWEVQISDVGSYVTIPVVATGNVAWTTAFGLLPASALLLYVVDPNLGLAVGTATWVVCSLFIVTRAIYHANQRYEFHRDELAIEIALLNRDGSTRSTGHVDVTTVSRATVVLFDDYAVVRLHYAHLTIDPDSLLVPTEDWSNVSALFSKLGIDVSCENNLVTGVKLALSLVPVFFFPVVIGLSAFGTPF
ncbi:hypothetical protein ACLI4Y_04310 [Natrialbaceae archaeon A-CW3]